MFCAFAVAVSGLQCGGGRFFVMQYVVFCIVNSGESVGIAFCAVIYHIGFSVTIMSIFLSFWTVMSGFLSIGMPQFLQAFSPAWPFPLLPAHARPRPSRPTPPPPVPRQVINHASVLKFAGNIMAVCHPHPRPPPTRCRHPQS